ncbi:MAG TPA: DUF373 family protein [archaeon]|nr:DUF373 family protein [archaeon]
MTAKIKSSSSTRQEKVLVLCIDRDDDIGQKTGITGPIMGKDAVLNAANKLGLVDPEDTDFNALFDAVRVYEEVKKDQKVEVVAITGHKDRAIRSDTEITRQLEIVLDKTKATGVILVTDGADDENVLPIIQSRVPIISVRRLVVRQAEQLESSYFKIKDFIDETLDNPKYSSLIFGLPAILLILLGFFGWQGIRIVLFVIGAYLVIKWFKLERLIGRGYEELTTSFSKRRFAAFFIYVIGVVIGVLAVYRGYSYTLDWVNVGYFEIAASFISATVYYIWLAFLVIWAGKTLYAKKVFLGRAISVPVFIFAISIVIYNASEFVLKSENGMTNFLISIAIGFVLIIAAIMIDKTDKKGKAL